MDQNLINLLIYEIKQKKQINSLDNNFILQKITDYFKTNGNLRKKLEIEYFKKYEKITKSKLFKQIVKDIRNIIGQIYGQFLTNEYLKKQNNLLLNKINFNDIIEINNLLKYHKSSRERINFYNEVYTKIFDFYKPKKIVDLACGLNPLSYDLIKQKLNYFPEYFAIDLNKKDMDFLNLFFKQNNIIGFAKNYDLVELDFLEDENFKNSDIVFLFKALDSLEEIKKNISKDLLLKLPQKYIVVSFPTRSLKSNIKFNNTNKGWLRKLIEDNGWNYLTFEIENEFFFMIKK